MFATRNNEIDWSFIPCVSSKHTCDMCIRYLEYFYFPFCMFDVWIYVLNIIFYCSYSARQPDNTSLMQRPMHNNQLFVERRLSSARLFQFYLQYELCETKDIKNGIILHNHIVCILTSYDAHVVLNTVLQFQHSIANSFGDTDCWS